MRKYLYDYIDEIDDKIKNQNYDDDTIKNHLLKISFFQHERVIHLLVTITYAIMFFGSLIMSLSHLVFSFVALILAGFLVPYIWHYFKLEKGVQYLYRQYDRMRR